MFNFFKDSFSDIPLEIKYEKNTSLMELEETLKKLIKEKFSSKLKIYILDSGSCNGCELELQLLFSPLYDLSSLGIEVIYDILEADILLVTGLMTGNMYLEVERICAKLKKPKNIMLIGSCPLFTAPFKDTFALKTKGLNLFSSSFHIEGCPPEPLVLIKSLEEYLKKI